MSKWEAVAKKNKAGVMTLAGFYKNLQPHEFNEFNFKNKNPVYHFVYQSLHLPSASTTHRRSSNAVESVCGT
ncbi:hypothetical protein ACE3G8_00380 [Vreelandella venusta]